MPFLQVKDNPNFNGREILKNNVKDGEKVTLTFRLCNPLLDLLFECYNVYSYELGGHMAFTGSHDLFKNYIDFWSEVKRIVREQIELLQNLDKMGYMVNLV